MTKIVEKTKYKNYLKKAVENLEVANDALDKSKYNPAVNNAIHCAINAIDSLYIILARGMMESMRTLLAS